ncbi:PH domain-containing protein [Candidatus Saccharibacteria bacterium]|nr:PH domain-containing protein [Candidatus Saccharibacteria bacterium]
MSNSVSERDDDFVRYFSEQFDDEGVLFVFRKHPVVMRKGLILASVGLLLPMLVIVAMSYVYVNNPDKLPTMNTMYIAMATGVLLATIFMLPFWISWYYSVYIVTDQRLVQITQKGFFSRGMVTIGLDQVQMVNYEVNGIQQTLLGFGTIVVQTFVGSLTINDVHHPARVQKKMLHILRDLGYGGKVESEKNQEYYDEE